jgi:tRNA G18 (ribose-2'-O)-methylase SpoU
MRKLELHEIGQKRVSLENISRAKRLPVYVLLDNVRSLYNVGSIFRTADAARVKKLILTGITGKPPRKEIDKTALGASETVPWEYDISAENALKHLKKQGIPIIILEHTDSNVEYRKMDYPFPCCLALGNEVNGIQEEILSLADACIEIPMFGTKHSLNVSVAFGIVIYEMLHQFLRNNEII